MKKAFFFVAFSAMLYCALPHTSAALASAAPLTVIVGARAYSFYYPEIKCAVGQLRLSGKEAVLTDICEREYVPPVDAEIYFDPDGKEKFSFRSERKGRRIDKERLEEDIDAALTVGGGTVAARFIEEAPEVTVAELKKMTFERGRFTTSFETSSSERSHNIDLAAKAVSGAMIGIGETFSFNERVGVRSEERGYMQAKIIKNGKFEDGLGGGVCQVSTTLYNAALVSGLEIVEYHPHTLAVSYVENSFDAMVSYGSADLKLKNNTGGRIFVAAHVADKKLTFVVYGRKNDKIIKRKSVVETVVPAKTETVESDRLFVGEKSVVVAAKKGAVSKGYLIVNDGKSTTVRLIRRDKYSAVDGLVEIGSKERPHSDESEEDGA